MIIINMLKYNRDSDSCNSYNIIYLITHGILLVFVIMSIYKTGKMFWIALKLNIDHEYKSSWSGWCIDTIIVLKEFLFVFGIDFVNINSINKNATIIKF